MISISDWDIIYSMTVQSMLILQCNSLKNQMMKEITHDSQPAEIASIQL